MALAAAVTAAVIPYTTRAAEQHDTQQAQSDNFHFGLSGICAATRVTGAAPTKFRAAAGGHSARHDQGSYRPILVGFTLEVIGWTK
jgi:hypothetical protein